jgi:dTDP-L-rhamnose 4-epimerase
VDHVVVTGGAGFIGSHLVPMMLSQGLRVTVVDSLSTQVHGDFPRGLDWLSSSDARFVRGSLLDRNLMSRVLSDADHVVHLAAETGTGQSMYEVARYNEVNGQGTAVLLDILANDAARKVRRIVLASSRSVYGEGAYVCTNCKDGRRQFPRSRDATQLAKACWNPQCDRCHGELSALPTSEEDQVSPASVYAATKLAQEDLIRIVCGSLGIGYALLRFQNVYGERQSLQNPYTGILSIFSTRIRRGTELPLFEDGEESRDFVHVEDVARAVFASLRSDQPVNSVINVGSGVGTSVRTVAEELSRALGREPQVKVTGEYRVGDIRHNFADITKLRTLLGIEPQVTLRTGLKRLAKWILTEPLPEDRLDAANAELRSRGLMGTK